MTLETVATVAVCVYSCDKMLSWGIGLYRLAKRRQREAAEQAEQTARWAEAMRTALVAALREQWKQNPDAVQS